MDASALAFAHRACCVASGCFWRKGGGRRNCFRGKLLGASFTLAFRVLLRLLGLLRFVLSLLCFGLVDAFADAFGVGDLLSAFYFRCCCLALVPALLSEGQASHFN